MYVPCSQNTDNLIFGILDRCKSIVDIDDLKSLFKKELLELFKYRMASCITCDTASWSLKNYLTTNTPSSRMRLIIDGGNRIVCPTMRCWVENQRPIIVNVPENSRNSVLDREKAIAQPGVENSITHGEIDIEEGVITYISFACNPDNWRDEHFYLLSYLTPYLCMAIKRVFSESKECSVKKITSRETDIILLMRTGKSNLEIGELLHISHWTVKNHVQNILKKLNVSNRTQAVARSLELSGTGNCDGLRGERKSQHGSYLE